MTYDDLLKLFYNGDLEEVISKGELYSLANPEDVEALLLQAIAQHDMVFSLGAEQIFTTIQNYVLPTLRKALAVQPNNPKILYNVLVYTIDNQQNLVRHGPYNKHIDDDTKDEFIGYAQRVIDHTDEKLLGYDMLARIYELLNDLDKALATIELGLHYVDNNPDADREARGQGFSALWIRKIKILERTKKLPGSDLAKMINAALYNFDSNYEDHFFDLATIAYQHEELDVLVLILMKAIKGDAEEEDIKEKLGFWWDVLLTEQKNGFQHRDLLYLILIIERSHYTYTGSDEHGYYNRALTWYASFPDDYGVLHFLGTYYFEHEDYAQALEMFERLFRVNPNSMAWIRYIQSRFKVYNTLEAMLPPMSLPPTDDHAIDYYNSAVFLGEFVDTLPQAYQLSYQKLVLDLYMTSYTGFQAYFEEDKFEYLRLPMWHCRAMCCANIAVLYKAACKDFHTSAAFALEGLQYSQFPLLYSNLLEVYHELEEYSKIDDLADRYFTQGFGDIPSPYNFLIAAIQRQAKIHLGNTFSLQQNKDMLYSFYQYAEENTIMQDDRSIFTNACHALTTLIYEEVETWEITEKVNFYEHILQDYPKYAFAPFQLMQLYNELEEYEKCQWAAQRYLEIKPADQLADTDAEKTYYFLLKAPSWLGNFEEAIHTFERDRKAAARVMLPDSWLIYMKIATVNYVNTGKIVAVNTLIAEMEAFFAMHQLEDIELFDEVQKLKAINLHNAGKKNEAIRLLDQLMKKDKYEPELDELKASWGKLSFFAKLGF